MKDTVIKGDGTSRLLKGPSDMPSTYEAWRAQVLAGTASLDISVNGTGLSIVGTPLNKENLLSDSTKGTIGLTQPDPSVNDALQKLGEGVQESATLKRTALWTGNCTQNEQTLTLSQSVWNFKRIQLLYTTNTYNNYLMMVDGSMTSTTPTAGWTVGGGYNQCIIFQDGTFGAFQFPTETSFRTTYGFDTGHKLLGIWGIS